MILLVAFFSGLSSFLGDAFDATAFATTYVPLVLFPALFVGKKAWSKTSWRRPLDMVFQTGIAAIEASETTDLREPELWRRWLMAAFA
jgi:amino acid transporter